MKFLKSRLFRLIVSLVSLAFVVALSRSIYSLWWRQDIVKERQVELTRVEAENRRLKQQLEVVQGPAFIEREAREKLGLTKEGEAVVLLPKSQISNHNDQTKEESETMANWERWWRLFF